jgi:hypothetical protein
MKWTPLIFSSLTLLSKKAKNTTEPAGGMKGLCASAGELEGDERLFSRKERLFPCLVFAGFAFCFAGLTQATELISLETIDLKL